MGKAAGVSILTTPNIEELAFDCFVIAWLAWYRCVRNRLVA